MLGGELRSGSEAPTSDFAHELAGDADCGAFGVSLSSQRLGTSPLRFRWRSA
jgi:hypothetical protein